MWIRQDPWVKENWAVKEEFCDVLEAVKEVVVRFTCVRERVKCLPEIDEQDTGFNFLFVGMLYEVQDADDAGSNQRTLHVCLLLLPN